MSAAPATVPERATFLAECAARIRHLCKAVLAEVVGIGWLLIKCKERLADHGDWLPWLQTEFGRSDPAVGRGRRANRTGPRRFS
jgi:hypothetical protein